MDIKDLQKACSILGIDYTQFVETSEIEKGVSSGNVDYKKLYEEQKALNEKILGNIGEVSKSFGDQLEDFKKSIASNMKDKIEALEKSFKGIKDEVNDMKKSPMRNAKSARNITVLEKAANGNNHGMKTLNLNVPSDVKELKAFLSDKAIEDLSKGISDGVYEKAALQLDASRKISPDLIKKIMEQDKILIQ